MSGIGDAFEKVKKTATDHSEQTQKGVRKAAEAAKERTGGAYDEQIDKGSGAATEYLRKQARKDKQE